MITQGDATNAFGRTWLEVTVSGAENISKIKVVFGAIDKDYLNPEFPLGVNLTSEETSKLRCGLNTGYFIIYDEYGNPYTCPNSFTDTVQQRKG